MENMENYFINDSFFYSFLKQINMHAQGIGSLVVMSRSFNEMIDYIHNYTEYFLKKHTWIDLSDCQDLFEYLVYNYAGNTNANMHNLCSMHNFINFIQESTDEDTIATLQYYSEKYNININTDNIHNKLFKLKYETAHWIDVSKIENIDKEVYYYKKNELCEKLNLYGLNNLIPMKKDNYNTHGFNLYKTTIDVGFRGMTNCKPTLDTIKEQMNNSVLGKSYKIKQHDNDFIITFDNQPYNNRFTADISYTRYSGVGKDDLIHDTITIVLKPKYLYLDYYKTCKVPKGITKDNINIVSCKYNNIMDMDAFGNILDDSGLTFYSDINNNNFIYIDLLELIQTYPKVIPMIEDTIYNIIIEKLDTLNIEFKQSESKNNELCLHTINFNPKENSIVMDKFNKFIKKLSYKLGYIDINMNYNKDYLIFSYNILS